MPDVAGRELCDLSSGVCPRCGLDADARGITRALRIACPSAVNGDQPGRAGELPAAGPGSELKKLLAAFGIQVDGNCSCGAHAREMDRRGTGWCRANLETIVDWLQQEAGRRKSIAARSMVEVEAEPWRGRLASPTARLPKPLVWLLRRTFRPWMARILIQWAICRADRAKDSSSGTLHSPPR